MKITFQVENHTRLIAGTLYFVEYEYSFDFIPLHSEDAIRNRLTTSLALNTLQIEVDINTGCVLKVWGYCPKQSWQHGHVEPPQASSGEVRIFTSLPLERGISVEYSDSSQWRVLHDRLNGWVVVQQSQQPFVDADRLIEIAEGIVFALKRDTLMALYLKPVFVDRHPNSKNK